MILELRIGKRSEIKERKNKGIREEIKMEGGWEFKKIERNKRLRMEINSGVGVIEVEEDRKEIELIGMENDKVGRELKKLIEELVDRKLVIVFEWGEIFLIDIKLNRKEVEIKERKIVWIVEENMERESDEVFKNIVKRMEDMDIEVGIGREIMEKIEREVIGMLEKIFIEVNLIKEMEKKRIEMRKERENRKISMRKIKSFGIIDFSSIGNDRYLNVMKEMNLRENE